MRLTILTLFLLQSIVLSNDVWPKIERPQIKNPLNENQYYAGRTNVIANIDIKSLKSWKQVTIGNKATGVDEDLQNTGMNLGDIITEIDGNKYYFSRQYWYLRNRATVTLKS